MTTLTGPLSHIPGNAKSRLRIWIIPGYGTLIASIHARSTLYAILHLKMYMPFVIQRIAVRRTHIGRSLMGARIVAYFCVDNNVRRRITAPLVSIGYLS